jgi:uncharacterized coiled-coil protein SlyX
MIDHPIHELDFSRKIKLRPLVLIGAIGMGLLLAGPPGGYASEPQTTWECSSYAGDAHTRCLEAFAESQRDQIAALQEKMQAQQETILQLKDQLDRQTSRSADLQRRLEQPPAVVQTVPAPYFYPHFYPPYVYPPVGLGLYFGHSWTYGPPFFYRPYGYRW